MCNGLLEAGATLGWVYDPDPRKDGRLRSQVSPGQGRELPGRHPGRPAGPPGRRGGRDLGAGPAGLRGHGGGQGLFYRQGAVHDDGAAGPGQGGRRANGPQVHGLLQRAAAQRVGHVCDRPRAGGRPRPRHPRAQHRAPPPEQGLAARPGSSSARSTAASSATSAATSSSSSSPTPGRTTPRSATPRSAISTIPTSRSSRTSARPASWAILNGALDYVRVDWFTPDGLSTWGDGRTFILGTKGTIELRKYVDVARDPAATRCTSSTEGRAAT
jgi:hypothetical protein